MTAQTELALEALKLSDGAWLINQVIVNYAAHTLEIIADYDEGRAFRLIFKDFYLLSWQILEDEYDPRVFNADVIGMEIGEGHHRKPAILTTDVFELIVSYGELVIEKDW